jgi:hypothetical protein
MSSEINRSIHRKCCLGQECLCQGASVSLTRMQAMIGNQLASDFHARRPNGAFFLFSNFRLGLSFGTEVRCIGKRFDLESGASERWGDGSQIN